MYIFFLQVVLCISVDVSSDYSQVESVIKQVMLHSFVMEHLRLLLIIQC